MKIRLIYDPILRLKTKRVKIFDQTLSKEAKLMEATMKRANGLGLAANQVGLDKQLIVYGCQSDKNDPQDQRLPDIPIRALVNPEIIKSSPETEVEREGCLSIPKLELPVKRARKITVRAQNLKGDTLQIKASGLEARILQHEIDHINGRLFTDAAGEVDKLENYREFRIVFFGSDQFSLTILRSLVEAGLRVVAVICETDKPSGRGLKKKPLAIKEAARDLGVACFQPSDADSTLGLLNQLQSDLIILASYGRILPEKIIEAPTFGSLNIHPSLLPKFRGATPIQNAILAGETTTGVTIIRMNARVDQGEIVAQSEQEIADGDDYSSLRQKLSLASAELLLETLPQYLSGRAKLKPQDDKVAVLSRKFTTQDGEIDWSCSASAIWRKIRALNPTPGTFTWIGQRRLKILSAELEAGKLRLKRVQLEGGRPVDWAEFVRGHHQALKNTAWISKIA